MRDLVFHPVKKNATEIANVNVNVNESENVIENSVKGIARESGNVNGSGSENGKKKESNEIVKGSGNVNAIAIEIGIVSNAGLGRIIQESVIVPKMIRTGNKPFLQSVVKELIIEVEKKLNKSSRLKSTIIRQ